MRRFWIVVSVAFALRGALALWAGPQRAMAVDSYGYLAGAQEISIPNGPYSWNVKPSNAPQVTSMPGYPLLLAAVGDMRVMVWLNALMGALTCAFTYLIAQVLWRSNTAAMFAGIGMAIDPVSIMHGHFLLSEGPYIFLFTAGFLILVLAMEPER